MSLMIVGIILSVIFSYYFWTLTHELSHLCAAHCQFGVTDVRIRPYPHRAGERFLFASVQFVPVNEPTNSQWVVVNLAPRVPNLAAVIAFPFTSILPIPCICWIFWGIFWGGGLVDLFVGSLGIDEMTDLKRAARRLNISPWPIRVIGWILLAWSVSFAVRLWLLY